MTIPRLNQSESSLLVQLAAEAMEKAHREWRKTEPDKTILCDFRVLARAALRIADGFTS